MNKAYIKERRKVLMGILAGDGAACKLTADRANYIAGALSELREFEKLIEKREKEQARVMKGG